MTEVVDTPFTPIPAFDVAYFDFDVQVLGIIFLVGLFVWINTSVIRTIIKQNNQHHERMLKMVLKHTK